MAEEYLSLVELIEKYGSVTQEDLDTTIAESTFKSYLTANDYIRQKDRRIQRRQRANS